MFTCIHIASYLSFTEKGALTAASDSITETGSAALRIASLQVEISRFTDATGHAMNIGLNITEKRQLRCLTHKRNTLKNGTELSAGLMGRLTDSERFYPGKSVLKEC